MHYIRLLRPPTAGRFKGQEVLSIAIAITTDLNDAFLAPHEPVELVIFGAAEGANPVPVNLTPVRKPKWEAGMRALKLDLPFPRNSTIRTIQIRPANRNLTAFSTSNIYPGPSGDGLILPVYADVLPTQEDRQLICFRSLRLPQADDTAVVSTLKIEEVMGESMAGHVWDGGLVTVSLVAHLCTSPPTDEKKTPLPILSSILHQDRPLHVIELGCGVGILGAGFARALALSASAGKKGTHVLMTDLSEAEERARANIAICADQAGWTSADSAPFDLDFEALDWNDGKAGVFGPEVLARPWDLVVLSDCTYNDLLPALVQTLSALHRISAERGSDTKIMLATKPRHKAEREFFNLMKADGWGIAEKTLVPLPVLYSEPEAVHVYVFSKN